MNKKIFNLIGLLFVTKKVVFGFDNVYNAILKNKVYGIIIGSSSSNNGLKKIQEKAFFYNIPIYLLDESDVCIEDVIYKNVKIIGITDKNFMKQIKKLSGE